MKFRHVLMAAGVVGIGWVLLGGRPTSAAGLTSTPSNMRTVEGKWDAITLGASIATGGVYVIVAADIEHWKKAAEIVAARARANPQFEYVLITMELARSLASERGETLPNFAWGGCAAVRDGDMVMHKFFGTGDDVQQAGTIIETVEGTIPALEADAATDPTQAPITAGFFPPFG